MACASSPYRRTSTPAPPKLEDLDLLPPNDSQYLADRKISHSLATESGMQCITLPAFRLPQGYNRANADLLLRLHPGYPDVPPDMWWFDPPIRRADGIVIPATELIEHYLGRSWQRWSRHLAAGQWKSGIDGIESYLALIQRELGRSVASAAA
jgi:hypothetical protein